MSAARLRKYQANLGIPSGGPSGELITVLLQI